MDFAQLELFLYEHWIVAIVALVVTVNILEWVFQRTSFSENAIFRRFGLDRESWTLLSCDMGGEIGWSLTGFGLIGRPDAIFRSRRNGAKVIIGEFKGRKARGKPRVIEEYQLQLYLGLAAKRFKFYEIEGRLAYKDGHTVVRPCARTFSGLLKLLPEYRASVEKRRAVDPRPLMKRVA